MRLLVSFTLLICFTPILNGQFTGGVADGHDAQIDINSVSIYYGGPGGGYTTLAYSYLTLFNGGASDGATSLSLMNTTSIFKGGNKDGTTTNELLNQTSIFKGGDQDGGTISTLLNTINIFNGSTKDGFGTDHMSNTISIFSGGQQDGYGRAAQILRWFWTGTTNSNWNLTSNWANGTIPSIESKVVIPSSVPHYPLLIGGVLNVGQNPTNGDYLCKSLVLRLGADFTLDENASIINYGKFKVAGNLFIDNSAIGSFTNKLSGSLKILNSGQVIFY